MECMIFCVEVWATWALHCSIQQQEKTLAYSVGVVHLSNPFVVYVQRREQQIHSSTLYIKKGDAWIKWTLVYIASSLSVFQFNHSSTHTVSVLPLTPQKIYARMSYWWLLCTFTNLIVLHITENGKAKYITLEFIPSMQYKCEYIVCTDHKPQNVYPIHCFSILPDIILSLLKYTLYPKYDMIHFSMHARAFTRFN